MQIDGGAGADVAADVGVQELGAPASNIQHPTGCTLHTPAPKMPTPVAQMCIQKQKYALASYRVHHSHTPRA